MAAPQQLAHTQEPAWEQGGCPSHFEVQGVGTFRCLLVAPHPRYRHYAADPERETFTCSWTDEQATRLGRCRVNDLVRYVGDDPSWAGQEGRVLGTDYGAHVELVVALPGSHPRIGICVRDQDVEIVTAAARL